jgi:GNAT superfamily N-acetyltransferase
MFLEEIMSGKGIASVVINGLEKWAKELNVGKLFLETGTRQTGVVVIYHKCN